MTVDNIIPFRKGESMELINKSKAYDTIYNICLTADASNEYREGFECGKSLACVAIKKMECESDTSQDLEERHNREIAKLKKQYEQKINDLEVEVENYKGVINTVATSRDQYKAQMDVIKMIFGK